MLKHNYSQPPYVYRTRPAKESIDLFNSNNSSNTSKSEASKTSLSLYQLDISTTQKIHKVHVDNHYRQLS